MKMTRCVICRCEKKITRFQQDNPILECGHILTVRDQELDEISQVIAKIGEDLINEYKNNGFDEKTADKFALVDMYGLKSVK
jgi:hypothetical protein